MSTLRTTKQFLEYTIFRIDMNSLINHPESTSSGELRRSGAGLPRKRQPLPFLNETEGGTP